MREKREDGEAASRTQFFPQILFSMLSVQLTMTVDQLLQLIVMLQSIENFFAHWLLFFYLFSSG